MIDRLKQKGMGIIQVLEYPQVLNALNAIKLIRSKSKKHGPSGAVANLTAKIDVTMAKIDQGQQPNPHIQSIYEKIREMNTIITQVGSIAHTIGDNLIKLEDKVGQVSQTALRLAIVDSDVKKVRRLVKEFGADFISKATWGELRANAALHLASEYAKKTEILDVILKTGKFDINGVNNVCRQPKVRLDGKLAMGQ